MPFAHEYERIEGMPRGARALPVLALDGPPVRFAELARGFGVEPVEVATAEALDDVLGAAMRPAGRC